MGRDKRITPAQRAIQHELAASIFSGGWQSVGRGGKTIRGPARGPPQASPQRGNSLNHEPVIWTCQCGCHMMRPIPLCRRCKAPRPAAQGGAGKVGGATPTRTTPPSKGASPQKPSTTWRCACGKDSPLSDTRCGRCGAKPREEVTTAAPDAPVAPAAAAPAEAEPAAPAETSDTKAARQQIGKLKKLLTDQKAADPSLCTAALEARITALQASLPEDVIADVQAMRKKLEAARTSVDALEKKYADQLAAAEKTKADLSWQKNNLIEQQKLFDEAKSKVASPTVEEPESVSAKLRRLYQGILEIDRTPEVGALLQQEGAGEAVKTSLNPEMSAMLQAALTELSQPVAMDADGGAPPPADGSSHVEAEGEEAKAKELKRQRTEGGEGGKDAPPGGVPASPAAAAATVAAAQAESQEYRRMLEAQTLQQQQQIATLMGAMATIPDIAAKLENAIGVMGTQQAELNALKLQVEKDVEIEEAT